MKIEIIFGSRNAYFRVGSNGWIGGLGNIGVGHFGKNMLNCLQLTCWNSNEACGVTQTFLQYWFNQAWMHSHCAHCTVTVPKNLHMQTCGVWMAAWLEHDECQLQAVEQVSFVLKGYGLSSLSLHRPEKGQACWEEPKVCFASSHMSLALCLAFLAPYQALPGTDQS